MAAIVAGIISFFATTAALGHVQKKRIVASLSQSSSGASPSALSPVYKPPLPVTPNEVYTGVPETVQPLSIADLEQYINETLKEHPAGPGGSESSGVVSGTGIFGAGSTGRGRGFLL